MNEDSAQELAKTTFTKYHKEHRHRKTPERFAILERISTIDAHFTAEQLYADMQNDYRVSLATVYNTLELLLRCNLITKHQFGSQEAHYEKIFGNSFHYHQICTNCGRVKEFSDKSIRIAIKSKKFANFAQQHYSLYIYGLCANCIINS
jgi:Fur family ferric uptake transcriptional regulator